MIVGGSSYAEIALAMDKNFRGKDINHMWLNHLKETSCISKPPVQAG
jgi:hypothetical protein